MANQNIDRRTFIGASIASTAGIAMNTAIAAQDKKVKPGQKRVTEHPYNPRTHKAMPTRNLGKTGYQVGIYSLGGQATLEKPGTEHESEQIVNRAIDLGINYIDTAAAYGKGISETNIGRVLKYRRDEVFLASKTHDRSYDGSMKLLEKSLK